MIKNVYLTELIPGESPAELQLIRASIREKLILRGIPVTSNIDEAHFVIIFFTKDFIRGHFDLLCNLKKFAIGYSVVFWDKKQYPPGAPNLKDLLHLSESFDKQLDEELKDYLPDGESQTKVRDVLRFMDHKHSVSSAVLHNRYIPYYLTDVDSLVNEHVEGVVSVVNPLSIDFSKLYPVEPDLDKVAGLIDSDGHDRNEGDTRFVVISGCAQSHDMTTITKSLAMTYLLSFPPFYHNVSYIDNLQPYLPEPPLTLAHGLLVHALDFKLKGNDFDKSFLDWKEWRGYGYELKVFFIFNGISSIEDLKEIKKLGHLCNKIGQGSMVILSTGLEIFKECENYLKSQHSVFLGYVDGGALGGPSAFVDNTAEEWRPFCLKLNDEQLGNVIDKVERRVEGGMPKYPSVIEAMFLVEANEIGEAAKELLLRRNEEFAASPKRLKLTKHKL